MDTTIQKPLILEFYAEGTFESLYMANKWCNDNGYSYGSLCGHQPVCLLKGDYGIAKWKNLTDEERDQCHGVMTSPDFREGIVTIKILQP